MPDKVPGRCSFEKVCLILTGFVIAGLIATSITLGILGNDYLVENLYNQEVIDQIAEARSYTVVDPVTFEVQSVVKPDGMEATDAYEFEKSLFDPLRNGASMETFLYGADVGTNDHATEANNAYFQEASDRLKKVSAGEKFIPAAWATGGTAVVASFIYGRAAYKARACHEPNNGYHGVGDVERNKDPPVSDDPRPLDHPPNDPSDAAGDNHNQRLFEHHPCNEQRLFGHSPNGGPSDGDNNIVKRLLENPPSSNIQELRLVDTPQSSERLPPTLPPTNGVSAPAHPDGDGNKVTGGTSESGRSSTQSPMGLTNLRRRLFALEHSLSKKQF